MVWMVPIRHLISYSLAIIQSESITTGITVTQISDRFIYLFLLSFSFLLFFFCFVLVSVLVLEFSVCFVFCFAFCFFLFLVFLTLWQSPSVFFPLVAFFWFHSVIHRKGKIHKMTSSFLFLLMNTKSGLLAGNRWLVCIREYQRILCVYFFGRHLIAWDCRIRSPLVPWSKVASLSVLGMVLNCILW